MSRKRLSKNSEVWKINCDIGREGRVIKELKEILEDNNDFELDEFRMNIGDFSIDCNDKIIAIIERKTWVDLANTIKDKSRLANHKKLLKVRDKEPTCKVIYIIEGSSAFPKDNIGGMKVVALNGFLHEVMFVDNCFVLYSDSLKGTADLLFTLAKKFKKIHTNDSKKKRKTPVESDSETESDDDGNSDSEDEIKSPILEVKSKKSKKVKSPNEILPLYEKVPVFPDVYTELAKTKYSGGSGGSDNQSTVTRTTARDLVTAKEELSIEQIQDKCLLEMNGITETNLVVFRGFGLKNLVLGKVSASTIKECKYPESGKSFGCRVAEKVLSQTRENHVNILAAIPGVSKKLAECIINEYPLISLFDLDVERLSKVKRNFGTNLAVGNKLAKKILEVL